MKQISERLSRRRRIRSGISAPSRPPRAPQEPHWFRDIKAAISSPVHAGRYPFAAAAAAATSSSSFSSHVDPLVSSHVLMPLPICLVVFCSSSHLTPLSSSLFSSSPFEV